MPRKPVRIELLALALIWALTSLGSTNALAEPDGRAPEPTPEQGAPADQPSVDESARDTRPRLRTEPALEAAGPSGPPVVTRALVRRRIETIDPAGWLARFGQVERRARD